MGRVSKSPRVSLRCASWRVSPSRVKDLGDLEWINSNVYMFKTATNQMINSYLTVMFILENDFQSLSCYSERDSQLGREWLES